MQRKNYILPPETVPLFSLSLSLSHTHTRTRARAHAHAHAHTQTQTQTHHRHTIHRHRHTHTHTHTHQGNIITKTHIWTCGTPFKHTTVFVSKTTLLVCAFSVYFQMVGGESHFLRNPRILRNPTSIILLILIYTGFVSRWQYLESHITLHL